ncbi:hypothetical protein RUM44_013392 [Polyplax serrata]|uniref:SMP-30/Gluconolactonase/LRE-like region domain-containing protein n=1 Tax=Polyplax serrata TaxID=468196 RepID=A0ABR1BED8_POLSC
MTELFGKSLPNLSCPDHHPSGTSPLLTLSDESAPVSIVIPLKGSTNKFAVTIGRNLSIVTWDGESTTPDNIEIIATVDEEPGKEKNQFNDGKVDSAGRLWIGTMGAVNPDGTWTPELGSLYSFVKNGKPVKHLTKLSIANGLIWNKNNTKMFYIDSPTRRVDLFDFDHITGQIIDNIDKKSESGEWHVNREFLYIPSTFLTNECSDSKSFKISSPMSPSIANKNTNPSRNRRLFFDVGPHIPDDKGGPDGMTIDENDDLWFAVYGTGKIFNVNGTTGELIQKVKLPVMNPTSVAFGGKDFNELYVTSATFGVTEDMTKQFPSSGCTLKITNLGVRGRRANPADL